MELLPDETYLIGSDQDTLFLTTHRVRLTIKDWGSSHSNVLFLEDISSIEVKYSSLILALITGIVLLAVGGLLYTNEAPNAQASMAGLLGVVLVVAWLLSRRKVISITPDGGKPLNIDIGKWSAEAAEEFLDKVQLAKFERRGEGK